MTYAHDRISIEANEGNEEAIRLEKLQKIIAIGHAPYPSAYGKSLTLDQCIALADETLVKTAGRLVLIRDMGKLCFAHIQDITGRMQIALSIGELSKEEYSFFVKHFDLGDFVGVEGRVGLTHKGEKTIFVRSFKFLGKALKPMPAKWHGLADREMSYRQRYLDLIANESSRTRFRFRGKLIKTLREFYWSKGFEEVETPILTSAASGALAKPFTTHHNALDMDVFLRIAPETYLKECVVGGFEKIFEIGRVFRNEGIDTSHLQDFTMLEHYAAYWDFEETMSFTEQLFHHLLSQLLGSFSVDVIGRDGSSQVIDFSGSWRRVSFRELVIADCGIDIDQHQDALSLRKAIYDLGLSFDDENMEVLGRGNLIDLLYKKVSRPKLIQPTFVTHHPIDLSPLARKNDNNPQVVDRFQLIVNTWEVVNAYSELVDPIDQAHRFDVQSESKRFGDLEAHDKDDDYVESMRYGMPPIAGFGMGVDRLCALLTGQANLRDVVLFPLMRPVEKKDDNK